MTDPSRSEEIRFRQEIREFVASEVPESIRLKVEQGRDVSRDETIAWQRKLVARGWGAVHWPKRWGGTDWSLQKRFVFEEEMALAGAPSIPPFNTRMLGPILLEYGTEEQKERFLPGALNMDQWWCQGYSEPSAGSDLAALRTRAVREGDYYRVNGGKIWTSYAHYADWMFCLVRTDPEAKKQKGISFLLLDMRSEGVGVEPIHHFYGAHLLNQVLLEDVKVPVDQRIGEENTGWTTAKALLEHERLATSRHAEARRKLGRLLALANTNQDASGTLYQRADLNARIAQVAVQVKALEFATRRGLEMLIRDGRIGVFASSLNLKGVAINQAVDEAIMDIAGVDALAADAAYDDLARDLLNDGGDARYVAESRYYLRGPAIAAGSNEVQRNIIAKHVLDL
ncbi:Acyl-CoA dehydrogenase [Alloalcanivorax dieselolei B5]|uniref:Acyl-CoA dehydrogenase n=1 Tax=Alcanivorax dieselolei (strain DSM 16502 / CGMCC 1.3690 / MCCC 1A00001 / B-5) TaxID=930169 RepID=K0CC63_ALCDB|nr:acyl-CoA dehydrogenase family protein [Alloalcanivorax dieselolei]AFT71154.1 Acyl-CoA dehydrogenase [Alloalcanivorax dieselolei B5]GGJ93518.1 acyl-CoA dehydrogenase [Alloalcanivorax dieselolei]